MVKIALRIRADLENILKVYVDPQTFSWWLGLTCSNCREETGKIHDLCLGSPIPNRIGRGCVHYLSKCKMCMKENSIEILPDSVQPYYKGASFTQVVIFECRNIEPTKFEPRNGWCAVSENGSQIFEEIDLTSGEWCDYDDNAQEPVFIDNIQYEFSKV